jgi:Mn2+/Fe2+ NRAMP family transporter
MGGGIMSVCLVGSSGDSWPLQGPGIVTGAADDDPSGIATYSIVGAQFGTALLWTAWLTWPLVAAVLKWLALVLFAYVVTAVHIGPNWLGVLRETLLPSLPRRREVWATLVAVLGTTISPYLFFWQASQEVEDREGGETSGAGPDLRRIAGS